MWLLVFSACTPDAPVVSTPASPTVPATPAGSPADVLRAFAEGSASRDEVLALARTTPLPAQDGQDFVFVFEGAGAWSLAGDFTDWAAEPMACANGICLLQRAISEPEGARYKFVQSDVYVADPWARSFTWDDFGPISFVRPPAGQARFDRFVMPAAGSIAGRGLQVFVPATPPDRVLYAHDGNNLFDPAASWGGWRLHEAVGTAPILVVGIENTPARFDEYTHTPDDIGTGGPVGGAGDLYGDFVLGPVRDVITANYGHFDVQGQLGSSLGGLIALDIARTHPGEVDFVASLSGTLGWGRFGDLGPALPDLWLADDPGGVVYLTSGGGPGGDGICTDPDGDGAAEDDPDASDNFCENRWFADDLAASGRTWDVDLHHWWTPDAPHDEAAWAEVVGRPLAVFAEL